LARLPLAHLDSALPEYTKLPGRFWDAVRFATGLADKCEDDARLLGTTARAYRKPSEPPTLLSPGNEKIWTQQYDLDFTRMLRDCFPAIRNQFVASGTRRIGDAIDWFQQMQRCVRAYVEVFLDPAFQFDQPAYHVLAAGLILPDAECTGVARDALVAMID